MGNLGRRADGAGASGHVDLEIDTEQEMHKLVAAEVLVMDPSLAGIIS